MERTFDLSRFTSGLCLQPVQQFRGHWTKRKDFKNRLSEKVLTAFYLACDFNELEIAERLLVIIGTALAHDINTFPDEQPRAQQLLVDAHGRLWQIKHPEGEAA